MSVEQNSSSNSLIVPMSSPVLGFWGISHLVTLEVWCTMQKFWFHALRNKDKPATIIKTTPGASEMAQRAKAAAILANDLKVIPWKEITD